MTPSLDLIEAGLAAALARGDGILFHHAMLDSGLTNAAIGRLVKRGRLLRLRRGAYALADAATTARDRYRLFVRASMASGHLGRVASHWSAAALHELPLIGAWPATLHITDPAAKGGSSSSLVTTHRAESPLLAVAQISGVTVTTVARTVVDMCRVVPFAPAVALVDEALRRGLTVGGLLGELDATAARYGRACAARAIAFGDGRAANAGESLSRARIHELGYVVPELQVAFTDTRGRRREVDFFWPGIRKIGEFDGIHKYTRGEYTNGDPPAEVVVREKRREDALRPLVNSFDRWLWDDAISPKRFDRFLRDHGMPRAFTR
jgi:hypothetical protein